MVLSNVEMDWKVMGRHLSHLRFLPMCSHRKRKEDSDLFPLQFKVIKLCLMDWDSSFFP